MLSKFIRKRKKIAANIEFRVPYSLRYLVLGLVGLVGLALWLVSGIALNKYRCEYGTLNSMFAKIAKIGHILHVFSQYSEMRAKAIE